MTAIRRRSGKPDSNMPAIRDYLRKRGCWVYTMPPDAGFDLMVGLPERGTHLPSVKWMGLLIAVEVKDGRKPLSAQYLTEREEKVNVEFDARGLPYTVVASLEDAARLLDG